MPIETIGPLRVTTLGQGDGPAILLCHGFGAPGDDLVPLARAIDLGKGVRWFFPEAPIDLPWGGKAWWEIDMVAIEAAARRGERRALAAETPKGMAEARAALEATIAEIERSHGVARDALVIGGFSQGAMLTTEVAIHAEVPFAGLAALSGNLVSEARWAKAADQNGASMRVLMTHGKRDPLLPFEGAEAARDLLVQGGADVDFLAHEGGHEIPYPVLARLGVFAKKVLAL